MRRVPLGGFLAGAAFLCASLMASACQSSTPATKAGDHHSRRIPLAAAPASVVRFCRHRARRHLFLVLCPARWPHVATSDVTGSGSSLHAPSFYWASFNDAAGFDDGDLGHLIIGGQRSPFSLVGARRRTWPRPGEPHFVKQLPLPRYITTPIHGGGTYVVQRSARIFGSSTVRGGRALVLLAPPGYPGGGLMSGHIIILWNRQGHGYFVSLHYDGPRTHRPYTFQERLAAALTIARSAQPPPR